MSVITLAVTSSAAGGGVWRNDPAGLNGIRTSTKIQFSSRRDCSHHVGNLWREMEKTAIWGDSLMRIWRLVFILGSRLIELHHL